MCSCRSLQPTESEHLTGGRRCRTGSHDWALIRSWAYNFSCVSTFGGGHCFRRNTGHCFRTKHGTSRMDLHGFLPTERAWDPSGHPPSTRFTPKVHAFSSSMGSKQAPQRHSAASLEDLNPRGSSFLWTTLQARDGLCFYLFGQRTPQCNVCVFKACLFAFRCFPPSSMLPLS